MDPARLNAMFPSAAEYLSNIFLIKRDYGHVTNTRLSAWMRVSSSAVTQALRRLTGLSLVRHERYAPIELTDAGRSLARTFLHRHYTLEHLLVRTLGYPWDKADDEAKALQSQISDDFAAHLYERLGRPQTCPHGNPLPGAPVERRLLAAPVLAGADEGSEVTVVRITEEGEAHPSLLRTCYRHDVRPGTRVVVVGRTGRTLKLRRLGAEGVAVDLSIPLVMAEHIRYEKGG
jgi:DtxR family Mn-dependent transcriptional regulator